MIPKQKRAQIIQGISDETALALLYDWELWARDNQIEPSGIWDVWAILTGRGWGKTRTGAEWVLKRVRNGYRRIALIGQTKADVRDTMVELGDSSILRIAAPWERPIYEPSKRRLVWYNSEGREKAIAIIYSGDEPDQLRGPQHDTAWVDELCKFKYPEDIWDNLQFGMRLSESPQVCVTTTPKPIKILKSILSDKLCRAIKGHTFENKKNLPDSFIRKLSNRYEGTRLGRQELAGDILEDNPDALWTREILDKNRVKEYPQLVRIVIAVDPQAKNNPNSAETGIIAAGLGSDGHGYILDDLSIKGSPDQWGLQAVTGYRLFKADRIIGEENNGGDMVEHTIKTVDSQVSYKSVRASRGKYLRAEPISALYEQGRVHHIGFFADLEDQLCEWVQGNQSPDRLDALVWAITELMLDSAGEPRVRYI